MNDETTVIQLPSTGQLPIQREPSWDVLVTPRRRRRRRAHGRNQADVLASVLTNGAWVALAGYLFHMAGWGQLLPMWLSWGGR